jgi:PTH2 family peptidyl-tRNA hydrolase
MNLAMYILVNGDLKMSSGKVAGQVGHAIESYLYNCEDKELISKHMESNQTKIVLDCPQNKLEEYANKYPKYTVRDAGKTELEPDSLTAVCIGILDKDKDEVPKDVKRMRLYNKSTFEQGYKCGVAVLYSVFVDEERITKEEALEDLEKMKLLNKNFKDITEIFEEEMKDREEEKRQ